MNKNEKIFFGWIKNSLRLAVIVISALIFCSCTTASAQSKPVEQGEGAPSEPSEQAQAEPAKDPEDGLGYRFLALPEYIWKGISWPIKRMSIFYEQKDLMERALDLFLNEERTGGVYPRFSLGGELSTGIGFTAFEDNLFGKGKQGQITYLYAVRGNQQGAISYTDPSLLDSPYKLESEFNAVNYDEGHFYPDGNDAKKEDKTIFKLRQLNVGARGSRPLFGDVEGDVLGRFYFSKGNQSDRTGEKIPVTTPGVDTTVNAFEIQPGLRYDSRDNPFSPLKGSLFDAELSYTHQINDDDFRYWGYTVEARKYLPLYRGNRILVLRGLFGKLEPVGDREIPFYELNILDVDHGLRGFERGRFRDRGRMNFNVEWRYPVWERLTGTLFFDTGRVFRHYSDISNGDFQYSGGVGFRFATTRQFAFRLQIAISDDRVLAIFSGDREYVRKRGSLLGDL